MLADIDINSDSFADFGGVPSQVDRYMVTGVLGVGTMGVVLRAWDPTLGREVALKLLRLDTIQRTDLPLEASRSVARARFMQEAQTLARLNHPNIVAIYDAGSVGQHLYLAMELVHGETLDAWLAVGRTRREVLDVMSQAADGLAAAHCAGVVHRDFKPSNVLVGLDGRVRVVDFGLASTAGRHQDEPDGGLSSEGDYSLTQVGMSVGTPFYMAPEQHFGGEVDGKCDQFAFCCVLHEALHGTRTYDGEDLETLIDAKVHERRAISRRLPRWLDRVLARGLHSSATARFADMSALVAELRDGESKRMRRYTLGLAGMAAVVAMLVPLFVWCTCSSSSDEDSRSADATSGSIVRVVASMRS